MKRFVTITLSRFAFDALSGEEGEGAAHVAARLVRGIRCYLTDRGSGRPGWPYPDFLGDREAGAQVQMEIGVEKDLWRSIEEEAARQGVSIEQMVEHAALYFAAEVNSGRVTERIIGDLDGDSAEAKEA